MLSHGAPVSWDHAVKLVSHAVSKARYSVEFAVSRSEFAVSKTLINSTKITLQLDNIAQYIFGEVFGPNARAGKIDADIIHKL